MPATCWPASTRRWPARPPSGRSIRARDADLEAARAAHREARDEVVFPPVREAEEAAHERGELVRDVGEIFAAVRHVRVRGELRGGHDDREAEGRRVPLDGRAALPDGFVVARAVQKVQDLAWAFRLIRLHADQGGRFLGQDHVALHAHAEGFREKADLNKRHLAHLAFGHEPVKNRPNLLVPVFPLVVTGGFLIGKGIPEF